MSTSLARDNLEESHTCAQNSVHDHRVPYRILAEERHGLALLQTILLDQRCTDVCTVLLDLPPADALFGDGIGVTGELVVLEASQR